MTIRHNKTRVTVAHCKKTAVNIHREHSEEIKRLIHFAKRIHIPKKTKIKQWLGCAVGI